MLILECSQGCDRQTEGSITISLHNFVGEGIINVQTIQDGSGDMISLSVLYKVIFSIFGIIGDWYNTTYVYIYENVFHHITLSLN